MKVDETEYNTDDTGAAVIQAAAVVAAESDCHTAAAVDNQSWWSAELACNSVKMHSFSSAVLVEKLV